MFVGEVVVVNRRASALSSVCSPFPVFAASLCVISGVFALIPAPTWGQIADSGAAPARKATKKPISGPVVVAASKSSAVAPPIKIAAKSPAKSLPPKKSVAVAVSSAPELPCGFAIAPPRVGQVTAKIAEAGTFGAATGSGPLSTEEGAGKLGGVAAEVRNVGVSAVIADADKQELASQTLRPQISAQVISKPDFVLPKTLRTKTVDRKIRVRVHVKADGSHTERLITGSGDADLDAALLENLRQWRWEPARQDDLPAASTLQMTLPIKAN